MVYMAQWHYPYIHGVVCWDGDTYIDIMVHLSMTNMTKKDLRSFLDSLCDPRRPSA